MVFEILIAVIVIVALIIGSYTDFKVREVPDWLSYSLIIIGLGVRAMYSSASGNWFPILEGVVGFGVMFGIAMLMFYTGQWGGGDSKVLMGLGALLGLWWSADHTMVSFIINALLVGAFYGLVYSVILSVQHRKKFAPEFKNFFKKSRSKMYLSVVLGVVLVIAGLFSPLFGFSIMSIGILIIIAYFLIVFIQSVEKTCMLRYVAPEELTEGDWIVKDIKVGKKVIAGPKDLGISKEQIAELIKLKKKKKLKKILIKVGIPFVPSFLAAYVVTLIWGNWFFNLIWSMI